MKNIKSIDWSGVGAVCFIALRFIGKIAFGFLMLVMFLMSGGSRRRLF